MRALPAKGVDACRALATDAPDDVLCPARIFVPPVAEHPPWNVRAHRNAWGGGGSRRGPHLYELEFTYGGPSDEVGPPSHPHPAQTHTPRRFLHLVLGGGRFRLAQVAIAQRYPGGVMTARMLGWTRLGGRAGELWLGRPWPVGGVFGGHLTFVWRQRGVHYFASLHAWVPRRQTRAALGRIVASLEPAGAIRPP